MRRPRQRLFALAIAVLMLGTAAPAAFAVDLIPSSVSGGTEGELVDNHPVTFDARITSTSDAFATDATLTFEDTAGIGPSCVVPVDPGNATTCSVADIAAGSYLYKVTYSGNTVVEGSVSEPFAFDIAADLLEAANVGRNYATFYPRIDSYRDRLTIRGTRNEPISVSIKIYNSSGKRVKSVTRALGEGAYTYDWNGRNSSGDILAAGKYRIVQRLTDTTGNVGVFTSYVNLSKKVLVTRTKYITKNGSSISAQDGSIAVNSAHVARLRATSTTAALAGYQFTLPSATIYKSIKFQIYTKAPMSVPSNAFAMQNFSSCPLVAGDWDLGCFDHDGVLGTTNGSLRWISTTGSASANRSGHTVRGAAIVVSGTVYIYKVRVRVVYKVLV